MLQILSDIACFFTWFYCYPFSILSISISVIIRVFDSYKKKIKNYLLLLIFFSIWIMYLSYYDDARNAIMYYVAVDCRLDWIAPKTTPDPAPTEVLDLGLDTEYSKKKNCSCINSLATFPRLETAATEIKTKNPDLESLLSLKGPSWRLQLSFCVE